MRYFADPLPHIVLDPFVEPALYESARFPDISPQARGRVGRDLYTGEPDYENTIASLGWSPIRKRLTDHTFVKEVLALFSDAMEENNCLVKASETYLAPYVESREQTETKSLITTRPPEALFNRFDFQATSIEYDKGIHVDWPRRLVGGVLFCCDADEENMEGGSFGLFVDDEFKNDRRCHAPRLSKEFPVRHNYGVLFLNCNSGFHGPTKIKRIGGLRKWIYYSISSQSDVWPYEKTSGSQRKTRLSPGRLVSVLRRVAGTRR